MQVLINQLITRVIIPYVECAITHKCIFFPKTKQLRPGVIPEHFHALVISMQLINEVISGLLGGEEHVQNVGLGEYLGACHHRLNPLGGHGWITHD